MNLNLLYLGSFGEWTYEDNRALSWKVNLCATLKLAEAAFLNINAKVIVTGRVTIVNFNAKTAWSGHNKDFASWI